MPIEVEVRKCTRPGCDTRANWPWLEPKLVTGDWRLRCMREFCQSPDNWEAVNPPGLTSQPQEHVNKRNDKDKGNKAKGKARKSKHKV